MDPGFRAARGPRMTRFPNHLSTSGQRSFLCALRVLRGRSSRVPSPETFPYRLSLHPGYGIAGCQPDAESAKGQILRHPARRERSEWSRRILLRGAFNSRYLASMDSATPPSAPRRMTTVWVAGSSGHGRSCPCSSTSSFADAPPDSRAPSLEIFPVRASLHPGDKDRHPGRGVAAIRDPLSNARPTNTGEVGEAQIGSRVPRCARPQDDEVLQSPAFFRATLVPLRSSRPSRTITPTPDSRPIRLRR